MSELVSIIIPAYNAGKWIEDAIRSALDQTWAKKEIIIVDDGSSDNTFDIAKKLEVKEVKLVRQQNKGASSARNNGLSIAQGDYIQWLDADDLLAPDKIEQQMKAVERLGSRKILLSSSFATFYYKTDRAKFVRTCLWQDLKPIEWLLGKFNENIWMNPATWLVSRELIEIAGSWDERLSLDDDGEYFCRVVAASERIRFVEEAKAFYRLGNFGSLSMSKSDRALESTLLSTKLCIDCIRKLEDSDRTRKACLKLLGILLYVFYPGKEKYLEEIYAIARELGGNVNLRETPKFLIMRKVLGWERARQIKGIYGYSAEIVRKNWDKILYTVSSR